MHRVVQDTTQISRPTIFKLFGRNRRRGGFTLIEIMIVLAIVGAAFAIALPRLQRKSENIKAVARHLMVLGKEVRNRARLGNVTMRIVVDLDPTRPKYWVERSTGPKLIATDAELEKAKEKEKSKDEKDKTPPEWSIDHALIKDKKSLPEGLYFASVETLHMKAPQTEGQAYIYFFPEGLMEAAALQITNKKALTWTLLYNPLTGQADVVEKARGLKEGN